MPNLKNDNPFSDIHIVQGRPGGGGGGVLNIYCGRDVPLGGLTPPYSYNGKAEKVYLII